MGVVLAVVEPERLADRRAHPKACAMKARNDGAQPKGRRSSRVPQGYGAGIGPYCGLDCPMGLKHQSRGSCGGKRKERHVDTLMGGSPP
jgi:hypothetical protein